MLVLILFVLGFIVLIKGAHLLIDGSVSLARKMKISYLVIGLTVIAFGTSAPELFINIFASGFEESDLVFANIFGSNLVNTLFILGISALIFPLAISKDAVWKGIPFLLGTSILVGFLANDFFGNKAVEPSLNRTEGLALIFVFITFLYYNFRRVRADRRDAGIGLEEKSKQESKEFSVPKSIIFAILGIIGLTLGGKWITNGAIQIADLLGLSKSFIGLTIISISTSLPELTTSIVATVKRNSEIVVGNIVGSSIFNLLWVLGVSAFIKPLVFQKANNIDLGMVIASSFLIFAFIFIGKKNRLERWQGASLILVYLSYLIFVVIRG